MIYITQTEGIIFIESNKNDSMVSGKFLGNVSCSLDQKRANLNEVKKILAYKAIALNANAITDFSYGQKDTNWFKSAFLSSDNSVWYAKGKAVLISYADYKMLKNQLQHSE